MYSGLSNSRRIGSAYKVIVSIIFGMIGFVLNFNTISFAFPPYTATVLIGLLLPMLVAQAWGWKYGLLSAMSGGCQSMWWLWGPSNGYAIFAVVPPFTLWVVWHGIIAGIRKKTEKRKWWLNKYFVEIPFRILATVNLLTLTRWAVTLNPPPWGWASASPSTVPMEFSRFVVIKQAAVGYIILLLTDVLMHLRRPRQFFGLQEDRNSSKSVYIISMALLLGILFWFVDSAISSIVFHSERSFLNSLAMNIPPHDVFVRVLFLLGCLAGGLLASKHLTRQRKSDSALRESEQKYRNLLENQSEAVFRISLSDGKFDYISPVVSEIFGYSLKEILNTPLFILEIIHPDFKDMMEQQWNDILNGELIPSFEYKVLNADGDEVWILQSNSAVYDDKGQMIVLEGICRDITEQKRTEEERELLLKRINEQALQMQQTIDTVPEGMILLNEDCRIVLANPVAAEFLSLLSDSEVGDILDKIGNRSLNELLTSPHTGFWHEVIHDDRYFEVIARPMEQDPDPRGWVMVIREVTQERETQKRLQQQEHIAAVGQLAAGIAHDFNNIMAVISLSTEMGLLSSDVPSAIRGNLETISGQADRAAKLIQQLLDFGRRAVLERLPMDLLPFFKEQIKLLERTLPENIKLKLNYGTDRYWVNADPTRLQQIVLNLAVNARDAMPDGGELIFEMILDKETDNIDCSKCKKSVSGEWVSIKVKDTGSGIPSDIMKHVFEPFFTTKPQGKGTGLGLAQVFGIVNQHEGHIEVTSTEGKGTSFILRLPLLKEHHTEKSNRNRQSDITRGHNEVILVVEDDKVVRKVLVNSLEVMGYRVVKAENGREALVRLEEHPEIELILSDLVMPEMGGQALFNKLKERGSNIPVVMMSGHPMENELEKLRSEGLAGWILKPPTIEKLSCLLAKVLIENNHG